MFDTIRLMYTTAFIPEERGIASILREHVPDVIEGLIQEFSSQTPKKGDIFVLGNAAKDWFKTNPLVDESYTVVSITRKKTGVFVSLAGKQTENQCRNRHRLKMWIVNDMTHNRNGDIVCFMTPNTLAFTRHFPKSGSLMETPFYLVKKVSFEYEKLRPKDEILT